MGISMGTVCALRGTGHDVVHLRERGLERMPDSDILDLARAEGRTVLTFDLDFGDLMAANCERMPSVVIFRLWDERPVSVNPKLLDVIENRHDELVSGAIITIEDTRHRIRHLPLFGE